jgi:transketolase
LKAIEEAVAQAHKSNKPTIIRVRTTIGFGSSKQGTEKVHGNPLGADDVKSVKTKLGFNPEESFVIPNEVRDVYIKKKAEGILLEKKWNELFEKYAAAHPQLAAEIKRRFSGQLPEDWKKVLPTYKPEDPAKATRQFSQTVINSLGKVLPELIGGSADLNPSTLTYLDCSIDFQEKTPQGRNLRFGVREHGMAAICNGLAAYGGIIPYCSTFLNFIGYAMGAVRLTAISRFGVIYIMTHDSIGLGEDGPTHQPIETLPMLRATPDLVLIRPADGNETSGAYANAVEHRHRPTVIALSRQSLPNIKGTSIEGVYKGAYAVGNIEDKPQLILVASGSEVHLCTGAADKLKDVKVRVVSMPSWELFKAQPIEYQRSVFPEGVPVLAVEAAGSFGWREYAHAAVAMTTFGASGPAPAVFAKFGFTVDNVVNKSHELLKYYSNRTPHSVVDRPW